MIETALKKLFSAEPLSRALRELFALTLFWWIVFLLVFLLLDASLRG